jgi:hypothetical protein
MLELRRPTSLPILCPAMPSSICRLMVGIACYAFKGERDRESMRGEEDCEAGRVRMSCTRFLCKNLT